MSAHRQSAAEVVDLATMRTVLGGLFVEHRHHPHVTTRERSLTRSTWLPEPSGVLVADTTADDLPARMDIIEQALSEAGMAKVRLDRLLTNEELVAFGRRFGQVMVHTTSPKLEQQVDDGLVFNLRQERGEVTPDYALALISRNELTLHAEVCVRPIERQPRYIALMCVEPSPRDSGGQTVFVPMSAVRERLSEDEADLLRYAHFGQFPESPPILSWRAGGAVFSFRDFGDDLLWWRYVGPRTSLRAAEFNDALLSVLTAMYDPELMFGVCWRRAELVIWDNWRFFHGRTRIRPTDGAPRHFKNLKIN
jgi:alpha-ketoglutarate-dependent taurine dioxygenase